MGAPSWIISGDPQLWGSPKPGTEAGGLGPLRLGRPQRHADVAQGESWATHGSHVGITDGVAP